MTPAEIWEGLFQPDALRGVSHTGRSAKMPEHLTELDVPFSTADTEGRAKIEFADLRLRVSFRDWRNVETRIVFEKVAAFKWDDSALSSCDVAPDRTYKVEESIWLSKLRDEGRVGTAEEHSHFRLYFNSEGSALDVVAEEMKTEPNQLVQTTSGTRPET